MTDAPLPPIIDLKHFADATLGEAALAREVLSIFRSQTEVWGRLLWPTVSPEVWADAAHTIKGAAAGLGAERLKAVCTYAETLGRSGNVSPVQAAVALQDVRDQVEAALNVFQRLDYELSISDDFASALRRSQTVNS
jgi:HPt (histidine-containing phosphotransfer) domain-containing protein